MNNGRNGWQAQFLSAILMTIIRTHLKGCSHGAIVTMIFGLMGCTGFSVLVVIAPCEHLYWKPYNPLVAMKKCSRNLTVWTALNNSGNNGHGIKKRIAETLKGSVNKASGNNTPCYDKINHWQTLGYHQPYPSVVHLTQPTCRRAVLRARLHRESVSMLRWR